MKLANEFEELVTQVRQKPKFSRFLLPREYFDLQKAAAPGPIVILNASQYRCDAFIILPSALHTVPLHLCDLEDLRNCQSIFRAAALGVTYRQPQFGRKLVPAFSVTVPTRVEVFKHTLHFLWSCITRPCLEMLAQYAVSGQFIT